MTQPPHPSRPGRAVDVYCDASRSPEDLLQQLGPYFEVHRFGIDGIRSRRPGPITVLDVDVHDAVRGALLKRWLEGVPPGGKSAIVLTSKDFSQLARARATGAGTVVSRPLVGAELIDYLLDRRSSRQPAKPFSAESSVSEGVRTLASIFSSVRSGTALDMNALSQASGQMVDQIGYFGLADWVAAVRKHHDATFQHCLLVSGVGVAFARHLGFSADDQSLISLAGMLHDLGKAKIPLAILDNPGALDEHEWKIMREHPWLGFEALQATSDLPDTVLDVVIHHHEYLDGSGYPHGLTGSGISDVVRMMTIADVFGALLERRSYKAPMSGEAAYNVLTDMGPKLDAALVREFQAVAAGNRV